MKLLPLLPFLPVLAALVVPTGPAPAPGAPVAPLPYHHPHDVCSVVALPPNFPDDPTVFTASYGSMNLFLRSKNRGFGWKNMRSGMLGHAVSDCEVAPDWETSKLVYVALDAAGLQRTTNGGDTWDPPLLRDRITQVEVAPMVDGERAVVCGGDTKVFLSRDGGSNWTVLGETGQPVLSIAIPDSFATQRLVAVGTAEGVHLKDGDDDWRLVSLPAPAQTIEFSPDFDADRTIWVGTWGKGVFRSVDGGRSFRRVGGLTTTEINDLALAPTWPACQHVFVATPKDGVHASRDGGDTWERLPMHVVETYQTDNHYQSLALSARYPEDPTVYCGTYEGLYCSNNGGDDWFELILNPTRIGRKVAISPDYAVDGHVFMIGYGNPYVVSPDAGATWDFRSRGARTMGAYSLTPSPDFGEDGLMLVGMGTGVRRTTDRGRTWEAIRLLPVSPSARIGSYETRQIEFSPDFANDRSVFAVTAAGFYHSEDAGRTWKGHAVPSDWTWRMAIAPDWRTSRTAFLGGYHVWRSDQGGEKWQKIEYTGKVLGLVCAPDFATTGEVYLVSESRGLLRSRDRGATWQPVADAFEGFSPTKIRLSPSFLEDRTIVVSTVSGGLFWSRDRGETWERCGPLGATTDACFDFVLSPAFATDRTIFGCVFEGIVKSTDVGRTWSLLTTAELYDDQRDPWLLRGSWTPFYRSELFGVGAHRARAAGREAVLPFTGTGVRIYGSAGPDHGKCEILVDGESVAVVDCYAEKANDKHVLFETQDLEQGFHDVCVRVLGEASEGASNCWIAVDAAVVTYTADDDENRCFARLENLYLDPNASYARDTLSQNDEVQKGREAIAAAAEEHTHPHPPAAIEPLQTADRELRSMLLVMQERLEQITADVEAMRDRIRTLDRALAAREQALQQALQGAGGGQKGAGQKGGGQKGGGR